MKKIITLALVATLAATSFTADTPRTEAASSINGVINSSGRSAVSWSNTGWGNQWVVAPYQNTATLEAYIRQLQALIAQLEAIRNAQQQQYQYTHNWNVYGQGTSEVAVVTRTATEIEDDAATLRGTVDFNNSDEATVYFRFGTSVNNLNRETTNVVLDDRDDEDFNARITGLDEDRTYYFRAIAEDEDGRVDYGSILSFRTDDEDHDDDKDYPEAETGDVDFITDTSARINGEVDMNDFEDGRVFFVYGEDEDQIDEVADDYDTYSNIDTDGDDLRKVSINSSLDNDAEYWYGLGGLDENTEIFYAICVEFEDEDGDDMILCGDTESFITDED